MADQGKWFKLWFTSITDNKLSSLPNELWAVWAKLGTYMKTHGNTGEIIVNKPERILSAILQIDDFDCMINAIKCFPNVTVTDVTNKNVTYRIVYDNWLKYQGDYSGDRVRKHRENGKNSTVTLVTPKKRREEKRREEKKEPPVIADFLQQIKENPAYSGIDIDRELAKMDAWLLTPKGKGKRKTKGFIVNWLNRIDTPVKSNGGTLADQYREL